MEGVRHPWRGAFLAIACLLAAFLVLPAFITLPISLTPTRYIAIPTDHFSLIHYRHVLESTEWRSAFKDSFLIAITSACLSLALGTSAAIGLWRATGFAVQSLRALVLLPLVAPPVVTALALSRAWVKLGLFDTFFGVMLAHAIVSVPFVFMTVSASLEGLDPRIEQAARSLGASRLRTVFEILLPNIAPGIATGWFFAFIISWDEIVVTLFVSSRSVYTLPRKIWSGIRDNIDPSVAAVSVLTIAVTLIAGLALVRIRRLAARSSSSELNV